MKREKILFFLEKNKINLYFINSKREEIITVDTSLFFKFGEIIDVKRCEECFLKILSHINYGPYYLKPDIFVLYNGIDQYDAKFIYSYVLKSFNYHEVFFLTFKDLVLQVFNNENIVVYHNDYYVILDRFKKMYSEKNLKHNPILIGKHSSRHLHYTDENLLWKTYKSYFTNPKNYGMIRLGDDK